MTRQERLVRAGDTELHLYEWGAGPPMLFWHALGDHTSLQMVEAGPILAGEFGYAVLGVDAPGFGGSPRLPDDRYRMPALVELADRLLDALELAQVVWMGSSWGGSVGVHFTAAYPERVDALVLVDGGYLDPVNEHGETIEELRRYWRSQPGFHYDSWKALVEDTKPHLSRWSSEIEEYAKSAFREADGEVVSIMGPDVYAAALHGVDLDPPSAAHERLGKTGVPVLVLTATEPPKDEERRLASIRRFAERVPHAEIRRVEGAPHLMLEERPEETARAVGDWLRRLS